MALSTIDYPPELVDLYEIHDTELGLGGFAKVVLASHRATSHKVAIKIVDKTFDGNDEKRIEQEISVLKQLNHQNICQLYHFMHTERFVFMILEYISGGELYDQIVHSNSLCEKEARRIFRQILSAVGYIHSRGIAHRDLKPENILLDEFKNVKIIDFGLSAHPTGGLINPLETLCGSVAYAAPELLSGRSYLGCQVDIWSLGVVLFTLLCGYLPFDNHTNIQKALSSIMDGVFNFPSGVSKEARELIANMLEPDNNKRMNIWGLAHNPWIMCGYGISVSWGALSESSTLNCQFVQYLSKKYNCSNVEEMIMKNVLNPITAHYKYLNLKSSYKSLTASNLSLIDCTNNISSTTTPSSKRKKNHVTENTTGVLDIKESVECKENTIISTPTWNKKRKANLENSIENSDINNVTNECLKTSQDLNESNVKLKSTFIEKITEFFTPKKRSNTSNTPRIIVKPGANVKMMSSCDYRALQCAFDTCLLNLKNKGALCSVKFENFVYKCEKVEKKQKIVFTMEICQIPCDNKYHIGILAKRMKGDSWNYKQAVESIIESVAQDNRFKS